MVFKNKVSKRKIFRKFSGRKLIAKKKRNNLIKLIKDVNIAQSEMKYKSSYVETGILNHNSVTQFYLWHPSTGEDIMNLMPTQGTTDSSRIGDRIYMKGIKIRGMFQIPWDRRSTRMAVYWCPHNSEQGDPSSDLFHNISGLTFLDPIQKKRFPGAKLLQIVKSPANDTSVGEYGGSVGTPLAEDQKTLYINTYIRLERKAYFNADASLKISNMKEYGSLCLCPFDKASAVSTANIILSGTITGTLYYKDL